MTLPADKGDDARPSLLDDFSRRIAGATSRRDAIGFTLAAIFGSRVVAGCTATDPCSSECRGSNGTCYTCSGGSFCSQSGGSGCSTPAGGVYCCSGGGGGGGGGSCPCNSGYVYNSGSGKCCPGSAPYYYPGTHGISSAGCYASCPYVGDCGSSFTHC
ncbi:MAG TPA: hypothetical protein VGI97_13305 [Gemmatimonadaceae bacterium]